MSADFLGRLHPLVLHLPIGLLLAVVVAELMTLGAPGGRSVGMRRGLHVAAALTAALAATTGWELWESGDFPGALADGHRRLAVALSVTMILVAALDLFGRGAATAALRRVGLAGCLALAALAGHLGGTITHGTEVERAAPPWAVPLFDAVNTTADTLAGWLGNEPIRAIEGTDAVADGGAGGDAPDGGTGGGDGAAAGGGDPRWLAAKAILDARCVECHGPEKAKKKLRLDTPEGIAEVVPSDAPADSELFHRISLPVTDLDVMPPEAPFLTDEEIVVLLRWIQAGAPTS